MSEQPTMTVGPDRRSLLKAMGVTAALLGASTAGGTAHAESTPKVNPLAGRAERPALFDEDEFPIGLWWPPPPFETTLDRYREIKDAGFTFLVGGNYLHADLHIQRYAMSMADRVGLRVIAEDPRIRWLVHEFSIADSGDFTLTSAEATTKLREVIDTYRVQSDWAIRDGQLFIDGGSTAGSTGLSQAGADWSNYTFAFDTTPLQTGGGGSYAQAGWAFRASANGNAYVWLLSNFAYTNPRAPGYLTKAVFVNGSPTSVTPVPLEFAVTDNTSYHVETTVSGTTITTTINGELVDTTTDGTFRRGAVGFRQAGTESALFDNVTVTSATGTALLTDDFSAGLDRWAAPGSGHQSFVGVNLYDEPGSAKFADLAKAVEIIRALSPETLTYINLLPDFEGGAGYARFVEAVKPDLVSFDRYPILLTGEDLGYFKNWAAVRAAALPANLPTWVFIQSVGYRNHAVPTAADLRWQINISLAYGCKGIQYFTYWTRDPGRGEDFHDALITVDGRRTPLYSAARTINNGYLAKLGKQLLPLTSESVQAANLSEPPAGLPAFVPDDYLAGTSGSAVVLGRFHGGDPAEPTRWLLVANYSRRATASAQLTFGPATTSLHRYDPSSDAWSPLGTGPLSVQLAPGSAQLLRLSAG